MGPNPVESASLLILCCPCVTVSVCVCVAQQTLTMADEQHIIYSTLLTHRRVHENNTLFL